ncbi:aldehyde dehydrogenase family protein [Rhodococcus rhodnii]|nr:bifunctional proline dehydrogenase/L-glutamate gamma-semialdehyde dehydrogenase [Rhodococcus rhodnii]TXG92367.1 aldehyde dehydrogenase family protein [Rhodococcus rhodnii]
MADTRLLGEVSSQVRRWVDDAARRPVRRSSRLLADVLADPRGLEFTVGFVDRVIRPEDPREAARALAEIARDAPAFVPRHLRVALAAGARAGTIAPWLVVPVARRAMRQMVRHLVVDASPRRLGRAIASLRGEGVRLNLNVLGEAVLGGAEAERRLRAVERLLARSDVDYVSLKVSSSVAPHSPWAFDEVVADIAARLTPLYRAAMSVTPRTFVNLDMEEYHDLDLTVAVFTEILSRPEFADLEAGIVLQAYLPDSWDAMERLQTWAAQRRAAGGAPVKVRVVKGANLPMERVDAAMHGWPQATWDTKADTDAHYLRLLDRALTPDRIANVRIGVAGHNLFHVAWSWLLAGERGVRDGVDIEMLLGMAEGQAEVVRADTGGVLLYTPVVHPREFDVAISYLVRRLDEGAEPENFVSSAFTLHDDAEAFERERARFEAAWTRATSDAPPPTRRRTQDRTRPPEQTAPEPFANTPDTDPSLAPNRAWMAAITARIDGSDAGRKEADAALVRTREDLDAILSRARYAAPEWAQRGAHERAGILRAAADRLEARRGELIEVMASETGKTVDQADPEVSEAVDFARWYALCAEELALTDGAEPVPRRLTVVTPPWNFPVAIPAGGVLAALATGSSVVMKPAPQAVRCGALVVAALHDAGVPRDVLHVVDADEATVGSALVADPRVDQVILTGAFDTARAFRSLRPELRLFAETSGKNAIVVTPSADLDLAVRDIVASAFGHAGQKCSACSLVVAVGSVARSRRFRDQLADAVRSLPVGYPSDPRVRMGPLVEPAHGKLRDALTTLEPGESWLVRPRALDDSGRLYSPGVREGVRPGSPMHTTEYFGPVLGIMAADDLPHAIALQNGTAYGLTAGLHTLDSGELAQWLAGVQAGNLYVNRSITGAIVRRQPFGGWKRSSVGPGTKAGGAEYLVALTGWRTTTAAAVNPLDDLAREVLTSIDDTAAAGDRAYLERALRSDVAAWDERFSRAADPSALGVERNILRYLPVPVTVRASEGESLALVVRVVAAGLRAGGPLTVSTAEPLPESVAALCTEHGVVVRVESRERWLAHTPSEARVRVLGDDAAALARRGDATVAIHDAAVTESGRIEALPFLREQAISVTAHRFGTPDHLTDGVL